MTSQLNEQQRATLQALCDTIVPAVERGQDPSRDTISLVRVDDRWRIADLGSGQGSAPQPSATP